VLEIQWWLNVHRWAGLLYIDTEKFYATIKKQYLIHKAAKDVQN